VLGALYELPATMRGTFLGIAEAVGTAMKVGWQLSCAP
jgi:hypothetical protein